ncbi:thiol reductant ABC exporter subunit CydC [Rhizosaccharibacter radicis]|uniref:Thiol reductant ABC exporter subunit CydC n=1 Tax=Rhizosaccharibacter radicis TaxID=2782605 RepID=A0ABT1VWB4_9PROT|nr:thiol reductant ABC exporter subunit CydC [Acetobacteraceae bacterium KSS12]
MNTVPDRTPLDAPGRGGPRAAQLDLLSEEEALPSAGLHGLRQVLGVWRGRAGILAAGVLVSVLALLAAFALLGATGVRLAGTATGVLLASALMLRLLGAGRVMLRYAERLVTHDATFRALADLRVWFFRRLSGSAAGGLGLRRSGDMLARLVGDVEALDGLYLRILLPAVGALLCLPVLFFSLRPGGLWLTIVVLLLFASGAFLVPIAASRLSGGDASLLARRAAWLRVGVLDMVSGLREIRAFRAEDRVLEAVLGRESALYQAQLGLTRRIAVAAGLSFLFGQLAVLAILAAIAGMVFARLDPIAAAFALFVLLAAFEAAAGLTRAGALAGHVAHAADRVAAVGAPSKPAASAPRAMPANDTLRFRAVAFRWSPDRPLVFDGLNLEIQPGMRVALLGPSGSGKSTLASLLLALAEPEAGEVSLGGVPVGRIDEPVLRARIAWLSQATHLFDDSIRANLLLGRPDADDAALWRALDDAAIGDMVRELPDGLDSWLGEGGARVSGGQGRRIALARTLLSRAPILILDEPCAGLDAQTEQEFLRTLNEVGEGRTVILIAHRLTGVEQLDRIWRLSGGQAAAAAA